MYSPRTLAALLLFVTALLIAAIPASAQTWDVKADTWVATDALGRSLPTYRDVGPPRANKTVGIFYFQWMGMHGQDGPYDMTRILAANPTNPAYPPLNLFYFWGEPELGYYLSNDTWVMRRHIQQLVDAGIDVVFLEATNGYYYWDNVSAFLNMLDQLRYEGSPTPKVALIVNPFDNGLVQTIYDSFYKMGYYRDDWFYWQGKPLIMTKPDGLSAELQNFFTFRQCWAWTRTDWFNTGQNKWIWLDDYPQGYGWRTPGVPEETAVTVAGHPTRNIGRSFHNGVQPDADHLRTDEGLCFAEQWSRALELDPELIYITGWNEWVGQLFISDGTVQWMGGTLPAGQPWSSDVWTQEWNRDIEPMKGGHTDNYYYQMIDGIRRYKGVRPPETPSAPKTIAIDGSFGDWADVGPEYRDTKNDAVGRDSVGWNGISYQDYSPRHDIEVLKVARDSANVYFYAQIKYWHYWNDPNWMLLFIDADSNPATGWHGYDYLINSQVLNSTTTTLKRNVDGGWNWTTVSNIPFRTYRKELELSVPLADLGFAGKPDIAFDFHWADNIRQNGDIAQFFGPCDNAPDRRFNYRYNIAPHSVTNLTATPGDSKVMLSWTNPQDSDFVGTVVRYRTDAYPTSPTDGISVCDKPNTPGSADGVTVSGLSSAATYYFSAFSYDVMPNYGPTAQASVQPTTSVCFSDSFTYPNGNLNGNGGWTGTANSQIQVEGGAAKINGGITLYNAAKTISCGDAGMGAIRVHARVKSGVGDKLLWSLYIDDPAGKNLACWFGTGTQVRGKIGTAPLTAMQNLTGGWDDLHVIIQPATNQTSFYLNGALLGTYSHASTGAGDTVGRIRLERANTSAAAGHYIYIDDLAVASGDLTAPTAVISAPSVSVTRTGPVTYTVDFSEPVLGFDSAGDVQVDVGVTAAVGSVSISGTGPYTVTLSDIAGIGSLGITIKAGACADIAGNPNDVSAPSDIFTVIPGDGLISQVKSWPDDSLVSLGNKVLYMKQHGFGYIQEPGRATGIRLQGSFVGSESDVVCLTGRMQTTDGGERYIQVDAMSSSGATVVKSLGVNNRAVAYTMMDGLCVTVWGEVKPGSITGNSYMITDGSNPEGIKVITHDAPGVADGEYVTATGAAGREGVRVIYRK